MNAIYLKMDEMTKEVVEQESKFSLELQKLRLKDKEMEDSRVKL